MPKKSHIIRDFSKGLNTDSSATDIEANQCADVNNLSFRKQGRIVVMGGDTNYDPNPTTENIITLAGIGSVGYGLFTFRSDYDENGVSGSFEWWVSPNVNDILFYIINLNTGATSSGTIISDLNTDNNFLVKPIYSFHAGALRISDTTFDSNSTNKYYAYINRTDGVHGTDNLTGWIEEDLNILEPFKHATDTGKFHDTIDDAIAGYVDGQIQVYVERLGYDAGTLTVDEIDHEAGWREEWGSIDIYVTWIYDGYQESKPKLLGSHSVIGSASGSSDDQGNTALGLTVKIDTNSGSTYAFNKRITGFNIYWTKEEEPLWLLNQFDFEKGYRKPGGDYTAWTGATAERWHSGITSPIPEGGILYWKHPPRAVTWETMNGYKKDEEVNAEYKTSVIANGKCYIGNIKQKTKAYPDRMLKSALGTIDVFPEKNTIDVSINDGDEIIKLEVFGDRLFQFKRNNLFIINISKEYEFLEGEYKNTGISNHNASLVCDRGVFWINKLGLFHFDGEKLINTILGKIDPILWKNEIYDESTIAYESYLKNITIFNHPSFDNSSGKIWVYNVSTQSFTKGDKRVTEGNMSNAITSTQGDLVWALYSDNTEHHIRFNGVSGVEGYQWVYLQLVLQTDQGYTNGAKIFPAGYKLQLDYGAGAVDIMDNADGIGTYVLDPVSGSQEGTSDSWGYELASAIHNYTGSNVECAVIFNGIKTATQHEMQLILVSKVYPATTIAGSMSGVGVDVDDVLTWTGGTPGIDGNSQIWGIETPSQDQTDYLSVARGGAADANVGGSVGTTVETANGRIYEVSYLGSNFVRNTFIYTTGSGISDPNFTAAETSDTSVYDGISDYSAMVAYQLMLKANALSSTGFTASNSEFLTGAGQIEINAYGTSTIDEVVQGYNNTNMIGLSVSNVSGTGSGLKVGARITIANGLEDVWIIHPGSGYSPGDVAEISYGGTSGMRIDIKKNHPVVDLKIDTAGSGYTDGDELRDAGGNKIGEIVGAGAIVSVKITDPFGNSHTGYTVGSFTCTINTSTGDGAGVIIAIVSPPTIKYTLANTDYDFNTPPPDVNISSDAFFNRYRTLGDFFGQMTLKTMNKGPTSLTLLEEEEMLLWSSKDLDFEDPSTKKNFIKLYVTSKGDGADDSSLIWKYSINGNNQMNNLIGFTNVSPNFTKTEIVPESIVKNISTIQFHLYLTSVHSMACFRNENYSPAVISDIGSNADGIPTNGETTIVNGQTYTWVTGSPASANEIQIGTADNNLQTLHYAIMGLGKSTVRVHNDTVAAPGCYSIHHTSPSNMKQVCVHARNPGEQHQVTIGGTTIGSTDAWDIFYNTPRAGVLPKEFEINDITVLHRLKNPR